MPQPLSRRTQFILTVGLIWIGCSPGETLRAPRASDRYEDLVSLFQEWRAFQKPPIGPDGTPDYTAAAMDPQYGDLDGYRARLNAIDASSWPVSQQVDHHLVRAEMNGLEFDHRVLRPWARNPAFYMQVFTSQSDVPAHEGPHAAAEIELWTYRYPLDAEQAARLAAQLRTIPPLLTQARTNLIEDARDLWMAGIRAARDQQSDLEALAVRVAGTSAELDEAIRNAVTATEAFRTWLQAEAPNMRGPSGVGIENYDWYVRNVHLTTTTWQDEVAIMWRELARSHAFLRLEEHRNRRLPQLAPVASAAEYDRKFNAAVTEYMRFLRERDIVSIKDYMDGALRERIGHFSPGPRPFFSEVDYRYPVVMRTHGYHWFDLARMAREPHESPIRRVPLLYNIFDGRAEGMATGMEEMMMQAGLFDAQPRARELIYILVAQRAARALGGLYMHANRFTMDQAIAFASEWTPRGWMPPDSGLVWGEQHLYLQQPFYGSSYLVGKIAIERLMAERARQLGGAFTIRRFMDELNGAGVIPVSLIRWELTGQSDEITTMMAGR